MLFSGVAGIIIQPFCNKIMNPENIADDSDPEVFKNVPKLLKYLGIYFFCICIITTILQPPYRQSIKKKAMDEIERKRKTVKNDAAQKLLDETTITKSFKELNVKKVIPKSLRNSQCEPEAIEDLDVKAHNKLVSHIERKTIGDNLGVNNGNEAMLLMSGLSNKKVDDLFVMEEENLNPC